MPDDDACIACGACAEVCPSRAIEVRENLEKKPATREMIWRYDLCIFCGQCERLCTTEKGVKLSNEFDLSTFDRPSLHMEIEKNLVMCEDCGNIIATQAHLIWLLEKLGPYSSGNYTLIYTAQKELKVAEDLPSSVDPSEIKRSDLFRVLCPKCHHQVIVFNQTGKQP